jgi:hypothetical protein
MNVEICSLCDIATFDVFGKLSISGSIREKLVSDSILKNAASAMVPEEPLTIARHFNACHYPHLFEPE